MKLTSVRLRMLKRKLKLRLIEAVKAQDDTRAAKYLSRLNLVLSSCRLRLIAAGAPTTPWEPVSLDQVKADIVARKL